MSPREVRPPGPEVAAEETGWTWRSPRVLAFAGVALVCVAGAVGFAVWERGEVQETRSAPPSVPQTERASYDGQPRLVFRNTTTDSAFGLLAEVPLSDPGAPRALSDVPCDRVDATATAVSCLRSERGLVTKYRWLDLTPDFRTLDTTPLAGVPSRTRLSPDGSLVASTVFVAGHGYQQVGFSTATVVREVGGRSYGNLERFRLFVDGRRVTAADRNIWGVTFAGDGDTFFATAATGGVEHLVRGDLSERTLTSVRTGAECPALSPDGRRVAYKVDLAEGDDVRWGLAVLDLRSGREERLPTGPGSIDDQAAWLDDETVIYGLARPDQPGATDVWAVAADGSGRPRVLVEHAWSPAVVR